MTYFARQVSLPVLALGAVLILSTGATPAVAGDPETCTYRDARLAHACRTNLDVRAYLREPSSAGVERYMNVPPIYRGWAPGEEEALIQALGTPIADAAPVNPPAAPVGQTYPSNSPGGVMDRINRIASGEYAASVQAERARIPAVNWSQPQIRAAARRAVADKLRDPGSAQFRNVRRLILESGTSVFCGEVNGRNAYGGYAGFVRFEAAVSDRGSASAQLDSEEQLTRAYFQSAWNQVCGRIEGVPIRF